MNSLALALILGSALIVSVGCRSTHADSPGQPSGRGLDFSVARFTARRLTDRKFERTSERLARGRYLYEAVLACDYCHAPYDPNVPGWPALPGKSGSGLQYSTSYNPRL